MAPVADMNLETYLSSPKIDSKHRQICLRRFFGCLATAVQYLHSNKIRHKDIKPKNILVKGKEGLLTDFGTSKNWSDDTKGTTSGTVPAWTKRYCAPEVWNDEVSQDLINEHTQPCLLSLATKHPERYLVPRMRLLGDGFSAEQPHF